VSITTIILVISTSVLHVIWNLNLKSSSIKDLYMGLALFAGVLLFSPLGIISSFYVDMSLKMWGFVFGTTILHLVYFMSLAYSYKDNDFSVAYPVARGVGITLTPLLSIFILSERPTLLGTLAIIAIIFGAYFIFFMPGSRIFSVNSFREIFFRRQVLTAFIAAITTAMYHVWDKQALSSEGMFPFPVFYMYLMGVGMSIVVIPLMIKKYSRTEIFAFGRQNFFSICVTGILLYSVYGTILTMMTFVPLSYLAPTREVGIVISIIAGIFFFKEKLNFYKGLGIILILFGVFTMSQV